MVPESGNWHLDLLEQMTLDIPARRPPVIDTKLAGQLQEYLSFRHRFRNLYGFELEWGKMEGLVSQMGKTLERLQTCLEDFLMNSVVLYRVKVQKSRFCGLSSTWKEIVF